MREALRNFIDRVVTDENYKIRVEANDMLPIVGTKAELANSKKIDNLYAMGMEVTGWDSITITAGYYA